jgi:signal transduction histidine kinase
MRYHAAVPLLAAVANLLIAGAVVRRGHSRLTVVFAWMTGCLVCWNLDIFALYHFADPERAEWWSRVLRTGICFAPVTTLHGALVLANTWTPPWRRLLAFGYVLAALLSVANMAGWLVQGVAPHTWGWYIVPDPLYGVLTALIVVFLLLTVERIWYAYRNSASPRSRVQAKFWLLAGAVQIPFGLTNLLPVYGIEVYPLGNIGNVFYVGIIAYAIARHRLMDVDYVVRKLVSFSLALSVVLVPGGIGLFVLASAMGMAPPWIIVVASELLLVVGLLIVPALQTGLETRVQRAFFPRRFDVRQRLRDLAGELVHVLDETTLVDRLGDGLMDILDAEPCEVFLRDEQSRRLFRAHPAGTTDETSGDELSDVVGHALEAIGDPALTAELESAWPDAAIQLRLRAIELVLPLRIKDRITGLVLLGSNREYRIFSAEDIPLLATVASAASVALENSRLSRELRRSEVVLQRANRLSSLGMLAAGIAHEIRNPLVAVKTFLDLLPQRMHDVEFLGEFRELSQSELKRVNDLISDLLALGKSTTAQRRSTELAGTLDPVVRLMESTARKRQVRIEAEIDPSLPSVWADPDQLKQIVLNLVLNAIDAGPPGSVVTLTAGAGSAGMATIDIHDEGPGIPPEQLESIFEPVFTTKESGTGLGLPLVHQMVVEHGGEISVSSGPGRGTTFHVTLPLAIRPPQRRTGT